MLDPVRSELEIRLGQTYSKLYTLKLSPAIKGSVPAGSSTVVTLLHANPYEPGDVVTIIDAQQSALNGPWTISAVDGQTLTVPATTAALGGRQGKVQQPMDLTGAVFHSEVRQANDPTTPLLATLAMALTIDPTTGQFTESLAVGAQDALDFRRSPYWHDLYVVWPDTTRDKVKYGRVLVWPNTTVIA